MIRIINNLKEWTKSCWLLVTHCGRFHADEVIGTVILFLAFGGDVCLLRTNKPPSGLKGHVVVYDIGYDCGYPKYDHHQKGGNGVRKNGIPYAAAGLLWRDFGSNVLENFGIPTDFISPIWKMIDNRLMQPIDAFDNGVTTTDAIGFTVTKAISNFNPTWMEDISSDEAFEKAFAFAKDVLEREIQRSKAKVLATPGVEAAIEKSENGIMILDPFLPWENALMRSINPKAQELLYVVTPNTREGYSVLCVSEYVTVPESLDTPKGHRVYRIKKLLPEAWAGLPPQKLQEVTGVKTAIFCHPARFAASASTLEDAKKLAVLAVSHVA